MKKLRLFFSKILGMTILINYNFLEKNNEQRHVDITKQK